jgi:hypothetical protein
MSGQLFNYWLAGRVLDKLWLLVEIVDIITYSEELVVVVRAS